MEPGLVAKLVYLARMQIQLSEHWPLFVEPLMALNSLFESAVVVHSPVAGNCVVRAASVVLPPLLPPQLLRLYVGS